jgi:hypothetical protein
MGHKAPPALLPPALAAVLLITFLVSGAVSGVLAHGLVNSLQPAPTATVIAYATNTPARPTASPTQAAVTPTAVFDLSLTPSPAHVQPGGSIILTATATSQGEPLSNLRCTLGASRNGGTPLLALWPPDAITDAAGHARWTVMAPVQQGTYTVQVSASGANRYSAWGFATVYVV